MNKIYKAIMKKLNVFLIFNDNFDIFIIVLITVSKHTKLKRNIIRKKYTNFVFLLCLHLICKNSLKRVIVIVKLFQL